MRISKIKRIKPVPSRCFVVGSPKNLYRSGGKDGKSIVTHNSVLQRNFVFQCIMRPNHWRFLGVDLKKVELSVYRPYAPVVLGIATTLEDALTVLRFAQQTMMQRYAEMEKHGVNDFMDLPSEEGDGPRQRLMVMVDEAAELLSPTGAKTDEGKADDQLKGEALVIIGSIARLGRASGVHLVLAMQRPDAKIISGEIRSNFMCRIAAGTLTSAASVMTLESGAGTTIRPDIKGRGMMYLNGKLYDFQGFFAAPDFIDKWLQENQQDASSHNVRQEQVDGQTVVHTGEKDADGNQRSFTLGKKIDSDEAYIPGWGEDMDVISEHGARGMEEL